MHQSLYGIVETSVDPLFLILNFTLQLWYIEKHRFTTLKKIFLASANDGPELIAEIVR